MERKRRENRSRLIEAKAACRRRFVARESTSQPLSCPSRYPFPSICNLAGAIRGEYREKDANSKKSDVLPCAYHEPPANMRLLAISTIALNEQIFQVQNCSNAGVILCHDPGSRGAIVSIVASVRVFFCNEIWGNRFRLRGQTWRSSLQESRLALFGAQSGDGIHRGGLARG